MRDLGAMAEVQMRALFPKPFVIGGPVGRHRRHQVRVRPADRTRHRIGWQVRRDDTDHQRGDVSRQHRRVMDVLALRHRLDCRRQRRQAPHRTHVIIERV